MKHTNKLVKFVALFFMAIGLFQACNSSEHKDKLQTKNTMTADHEHNADNDLSLNNGAKWKADASTNENVSALNAIIMASEPVTLEDYNRVGQALQTGINTMISECKMQGPDHNALHHWLEPLMEENKKLQDASSLDMGKEAFVFVSNQVKRYPQYFE